MTFFNYDDSPYPIREDIKAAHRNYWDALKAPGNWWNGSERIAIAQEVRNANRCDYCTARKEALSPYTFAGKHSHSGSLSLLAVDAIHRIVTDQHRITQHYIDTNSEAGLSDAEYIELAGIVVAVFSIDEFNRGLGLDPEHLPIPEPGEPDHYRPPQAVKDIAFVPMIPIDGATGNEADLWKNGRTANVLRALSLVPNGLREWRNLASAQYLSLEGMANFIGQDDRTINRMQMELVAGRVSSYNECFY